MNGWLALFRGLLLMPIVGGVVYGIACVVAVRAFSQRYALKSEQTCIIWPPVTVLKLIYGMEKDLKVSLQSICSQDYPDYQVVLSVQRMDDPALPLLWEIAEEFGPKRVSVVAIASEPVVNGKVQNLIQALTA